VERANTRPGAATLSAFSAVVVLLGINFVAVRFSNAELPPFWGSGVRFAAAALILFALSSLRRVPFPRDRSLHGAILYGGLAFGATYALAYWGLLTVPSGVTAVIFASIPLLTFVMALALKMERFRAAALAGAGLAFLGIAVISYEQVRGQIDPMGLAAIIVGSVTAAASAIVVKRTPKAHPLATNAVAMGVGAAILVPLSLLAGEPWPLPTLPATWVALIYLVTSSVIAFALFVWILQRWTVSAVSYQTVLSPLVTIAVAAGLVAEPVTVTLAAGTALVLGGVFVGAIWRGGPRPEGPPAAGAPPPAAQGRG